MKSTATFRLCGKPRKTLRDLASALQAFDSGSLRDRVPNVYSWDSFRDVQRLGEGSSYVVDRCLSVSKQVVAVKRTLFAATGLREPPPESGQFSFDDQIDVLYTEVRALLHAPLRDHPNIASLVGYGWHVSYDISLPFIVVEYATCGTLDLFLQSDPPKDWATKLKLIQDAAAGLQALHLCKIIHGDVKLQNVLVFNTHGTNEVTAKLSDFGHAIIWPSTRAFEPLYCGTPLFNAPEVHNQDSQLIAAESMPACDVYSFGLLIWSVVKNGYSYFDDSWLESPQDDKIDFLMCCDCGFIIREALHYLESIEWYSCVESVGKVITRTLAFNPQDRGSMDEVSQLLNHIDPSRNITLVETRPLDEQVLKENAKDFGPVELLRTYPPWPASTRKELFTGYSSPYAQKGQKGLHLSRKSECSAVGFGVSENVECVLKYLKESAEEGFVPAQLCYPRIKEALQRDLEEGASSYLLNYHQLSDIERALQEGIADNLNGVPPQEHYSHRLRVVQQSFVKYLHEFVDTSSVESATNSPMAFILGSYINMGYLTEDPVDWSDEKLNDNHLQYAICYLNDVSRVQRILQVRPDLLESVDDEGNTPILRACKLGRTTITHCLLALGARASIRDSSSHAPLHFLNQFPSPDVRAIAKALVDAGADLNAQTPYPELFYENYFQTWGTPLHWAIASNNLEVVCILLDLGADPLLSTLDGIEYAHEHFTPLHMAAGLHLSGIADELLSRASYEFPGPWPLHMLSRAAPFQKWMIHGGEWRQTARETIRVFLKHGHQVDQLDHTTQTPLASAVLLLPTFICSEPIVQELLLHGADPNALVGMFKKPLIFLAIDGLEGNPDNTACLAILSEAGADLNARDPDGNTPLMMAYRHGAYAAAYFLIQSGVDVNASSRIGFTALHHAVQGGAPENTILHLIQAGAFIDAPAGTGVTPLGLAITSGKLETIDTLLSLGASVFVNQTIDPCHTILHQAFHSLSDHRSVLFHLLSPASTSRRLEIGQLCEFGYYVDLWTPLHQAVLESDYACVQELVRFGASIDKVAYRISPYGTTPVQLAEMIMLKGMSMASFKPKKRFAAVKILRFLNRMLDEKGLETRRTMLPSSPPDN